MAELLAAGTALGVVSSLVTFSDVAWRVLKRLREYNDRTSDAPAVIKNISVQLPVLIDKMTEVKLETEMGSLSINPQTALAVAVTSCDELIQRLDVVTKKLLPEETDSRSKRIKKAFSSVYYEKELSKAWGEIESYKTLLILHFTKTKGAVQELETPRSKRPIFMVPFERDLKFVGRVDINTDIKQALQRQRRVAIAGIGGVGKSQIAIEYCYRFKEEHPEAQVFWVHASTVARFRQAYKDIARRLLIPGWNDPKVDTLQLVYEQLTDKGNCRWLLILDNADDTEVFFPSTEVKSKTQGELGGVARYLPHNSRGSIIITTRNVHVGRKLANGEKPITVLRMTVQEAKTMMLSKVSESCCESDLDRLLANLEYLPLAITQAAGFITETRITLSAYLNILNADDASILDKEFNDWRRDSEASNSVIQTWKLSFDQIRRQHPRAADMLSLMAVLDRQGLQSFLLYENNEQEAEFVIALGILQAFLLITSEKGGKAFEMHRLVQLATQRWLYLQGSLNNWQERALSVLSEKFPLGTYENWSICEVLSPHAQVILCCAFESKSCMLQYARLLNNFGYYNQTQGRYKVAYKKISKALKEREKALGKEHPDTLISVSNLAEVLESQGKYEAAEEMDRRALDGYEKALGKEHPDTLTSVSNLALVLQYQGKYEAAEEMNRRALSGREKALGEEHPNTLASVGNLASVLESQGKYEAAEEMNQRVLDGHEKALGKEHPFTLVSVSNLALVLNSQGKYKAAEEMNRRALDGREKALGKEHPDTLTSVSDLALVLQYQGKYEAAEEMNRRALGGREKALGEEHPDTLTSVSNLALVLESQGKYEAAEEMNQRVLDGYEKALGKEHPFTLTSVSNLALVLSSQGKYKAAEEMNRRALDSREKALGKEHPDTLTSVGNLAEVLRSQGMYEAAEEMNRRALGGREKALGEEHPDTLTSVSNLALVLESQGKHEAAEEMNQQALDGYEKVLGKEHPFTLMSVYCLACLLHRRQEYNAASELYQKASSGFRKTLGLSHPTTIACEEHYSSMMQKIEQDVYI